MNFELARENMVKQQVLTEGLSLDGVAKIMTDIPREIFLPKEYQSLAYCDTNLVIDDRELRSPMFTARLIEALAMKKTDDVLKLGLETGYPVALIAKLCNSVELVDYDEERLAMARRNLAKVDVYNVEFNSAEHLTNIIKNAKKYNCIYISNVVEENEVDESLLDLLEVGGRLVFVVRTDVCDKAYLITKAVKETYQKNFLFNVYNR
ncbi:protein-L-isoaspartate O-methyltransferase family protein [Francisella philomiragia]|uniref:protein-L-isoaspartate O-methyltransferase family protein n=1 Tax=Francisella philomiragia TaxID=28110 RepID=UPI001906758F|nr:protein-L-isoaspartate O-methyltransferase [Francisella philomiragia]MBK2267171.1 protein-L-isoaspartate O-methyltransferase [Francisella philomiragia]MBK2278816.1 protein-L-isoaspartate O-methyltransferase [Francisella philomiragia]MBK2286670.1 protein-L-isoaspartate O-methyltransferase [Francisella philomiragia]MBK2288456.1 protein-L-isoaspartate O-methyltransferase [Francisella philomiragia]MBK2290177.1 protein-L-isoaspartate O-methyltransferase [Francisella philomiragia]